MGITSRMQVKFSSLGQTGDLGVRSKGQISLNFSLHVNFKDFQTLCVFPKITKHIRQDFHSVTLVGLWGSGCAQGGQKLFFFKNDHVAYQMDRDDKQMTSRTKCK